MRVLRQLLIVGAVVAILAAVAGPAVAAEVCVSVNGEVIADSAGDGTECESSGSETSSANVAVAVNGGSATIDAEGGIAIAVNDSTAWVPDSSGNHAVAVNGSSAAAHDGDSNRAVAVNGSVAFALFGDGNRATAINDSAAVAVDGSSSSTSINESYAEASGEAASAATAVNCGEAVADDGDAATDINGDTCFVGD